MDPRSLDLTMPPTQKRKTFRKADDPVIAAVRRRSLQSTPSGRPGSGRTRKQLKGIGQLSEMLTSGYAAPGAAIQ